MAMRSIPVFEFQGIKYVPLKDVELLMADHSKAIAERPSADPTWMQSRLTGQMLKEARAKRVRADLVRLLESALHLIDIHEFSDASRTIVDVLSVLKVRE